jgi:Flp pilus assembly protein TadG
MRRSEREKGAIAVEMAILLPVLIVLLLGMMEFGRALNTQATLSHAARESVRVVAVTKDASKAKAAADGAAPTLTPALIVVSVTPTGPCTAPATRTVTINYQLSTLTGIAGPFAMKAQGVMLCGG